MAMAALMVIAPALLAAAPPRLAAGDSAEQRFERVLQGITGGKLPAALDEMDRLAERYPNWRLAHLVHGDLLQLDRAQSNAIVVDAGRSRVFVYENTGDTPRLVQDFYTTLCRNGVDKLREGDRKTPLGVYRVTARIPGRKLPDLYGWGAFPISYPGEWDRMAGRTGFGIWLHGVPSDTYARAPWASDGCVALANTDIAELAKRVQVGVTPVIITEQIEWTTSQAWREEREAFMNQLEAWRRDWESLDAGRYLAHYAREFRSDGMDIDAWSAHKLRVNASKRWVKVSFDNVSLLRSPGPKALMVVNFDQNYRSSNLDQRTRKRQ